MSAIMSNRIVYVPFDHLNRHRGALRTAVPGVDTIVLVESRRMTTGRPWHPERLFFLVSSARHFAAELRTEGFDVRYVVADTTIDGLEAVRSDIGPMPVICAEPSSYRQMRDLTAWGAQMVPNDFFLTSRPLFAEWAGGQKTFVMENFYRAQRLRLGILVPGGKPEGGQWNYDAENRLSPPKNYTWPPYLEHERDDIDREVAAELGHEPTTTWATTRAGALRQLNRFIDVHLAGFGPYEDAITDDNWALHHSLLSPYLNNGLLHASELVTAALAAYSAGNAPIQSVEAFIRQVVGWREYINGMYWFLGEDYRELNSLEAGRSLLPVFTDSRSTRMNCVGSVVKGVEDRAWVHHIPRLMVLSNLALLTGTNPQEFLDWMREQFIDAAEWVMVPNIIGMATHADGGVLMTKPYAAGGAYIKRMTDYCKGCAYKPTERTGDRACPFTTLYWDFMERHLDEFKRNHRMFQQVNGLARLSDREQLRVRAQQVLAGLEAGRI